jgi:hypothetical protein
MKVNTALHIILLSAFPISAMAQTQKDGDLTGDDLDPGNLASPPLEMLEFLATYGELDDETFEMIVYHGLDDAQKQQDEQEDAKTQSDANGEDTSHE